MKLHGFFACIAVTCVLPTVIFSQNPFNGIVFGSASETIQAGARDVSNKQSWEETAFEVANPPYVLLQQFKPSRCTLTYYKKRLYSARCEFDRDTFRAILDGITAMRQKPSNLELAKRDKSATWYGAYRDGRFEDTLNLYQLSDATVVDYSDEKQKDFRFGDLFRGMTPWLILTIVGLFVLYLTVAWLLSSKCPKCKRRKLKITGKSFHNPKDYNPDILGSPDVHWDEVYHYKCAHCGFEKDDRYSGFMNWWRSRED